MKIKVSYGSFQTFHRCTSCDHRTPTSRMSPCPRCGEMTLLPAVARWVTLATLNVFNWEREWQSKLLLKGEVLMMDADAGPEIAVNGKIYRGQRMTHSVMKEAEAEAFLDSLPMARGEFQSG